MKFEIEATYTLPFATIGGLPLAKFSGSSPGPVLDHKTARFSASKAYRSPGTVIWLASPARGSVAQRMPVAGFDPSAEIVIMPPGMPLGGSTNPDATAG